jgi:pimeloyl-ACP methyl ester carboxylesterase
MRSTRSADGTLIAYDQTGEGPPLVLITGALHDGSSAQALAARLAPGFTVFSYDRRGRGASGDTPRYAAAREIEDLAAVLALAGGPACVYGHSSGGVLALEAAVRDLPITRLAVYEPPYAADSEAVRRRRVLTADVSDALATGRDGDAVQMFLLRAMALREPVVTMLRTSRMWPAMEALAPTLAYDLAVVDGGAIRAERLGSVTIPVLFLDGAASPGWARDAVRAAAAAVPGSRRVSLPGQDHSVSDLVLAPLLSEFFTASGVSPGTTA